MKDKLRCICMFFETEVDNILKDIGIHQKIFKNKLLSNIWWILMSKYSKQIEITKRPLLRNEADECVRLWQIFTFEQRSDFNIEISFNCDTSYPYIRLTKCLCLVIK